MNDLETLAPSSVTVVIGNREFTQRPLSLRGTTRLVSVIAEEFGNAASSPALANLLETDLDQVNAVEAAPLLLKVLQSVPNALPRVITIILTGTDEESDVDFIDANCGIAAALRVFRVFMEQNEPEELIENFTVLRTMLSTAMSKAKEKVG